METERDQVMAAVKAIGLMSGTSMDGIDVALVETDGEALVRPGLSRGFPYEAELRAQLKRAMRLARELGPDEAAPPEITEAERALTLAHAAAVRAFCAEAAETAGAQLLGFHGQTILHEPERRFTWQLGDGALLAQLTGFDTVYDFRSADVAAGGQGAPFVPLYHAALISGLRSGGTVTGPVAALNLGGVGNLTFVGEGGALLAFDTGPANGPIDDWIELLTGGRMDQDGVIAGRGQVHEELVRAGLANPYFDLPPPKSLDRGDFSADLARGLSLEDGAATLTAFSAAAVAAARDHLPAVPRLWIVCGGGRKNPTLIAALRERLGAPVIACEEVGWNGDALEAEAFAYLAVRSAKGLALSLPETTGVSRPMPGGRMAKAGPGRGHSAAASARRFSR